MDRDYQEKNHDHHLLEVRGLKKYFPIKKGIFSKVIAHVKAVDGIDFSVSQGKTLGIVGESGCGKTTTARLILRLEDPDEGQIFFKGENILDYRDKDLRVFRREIQMIFQNPYSSLNPRKSVKETIAEPLIVHNICKRSEVKDRVVQLLENVGLRADCMNRYPHEFSGGQRQRIGIARALALNPRLIICDEPVSALDVSIRSQIINLLLELQEKFGLTYIFIAHDLSVVEHISDRVAVMYLGKIVEMGDTEKLYLNPLHPYTRALLSATPVPDPFKKKERIILYGDVPNPVNPPDGCRFHTRCFTRKDICSKIEPSLQELSPGHWVACHLYKR